MWQNWYQCHLFLLSDHGDQDCLDRTLLGKSSPSPCYRSSWPSSWSSSSGLSLMENKFTKLTHLCLFWLKAPHHWIMKRRMAGDVFNSSHLLWKCVVSQTFPTDTLFWIFYHFHFSCYALSNFFITFTFPISLFLIFYHFYFFGGTKVACSAVSLARSDISKLIPTQAVTFQSQRLPWWLLARRPKVSVLQKLQKMQPISETAWSLCNPPSSSINLFGFF